MWREEGEVSVSARPFLGALTLATCLASSLSSFSVTAASTIAARSPSGTEARIRAWSRSSLSRSPALAVNWTLYRPGARGSRTAGRTGTGGDATAAAPGRG